MKNKRILSFIIIVSCLFLLAGCGKKTVDAPSKESERIPVSEESVIDEKNSAETIKAEESTKASTDNSTTESSEQKSEEPAKIVELDVFEGFEPKVYGYSSYAEMSFAIHLNTPVDELNKENLLKAEPASQLANGQTVTISIIDKEAADKIAAENGYSIKEYEKEIVIEGLDECILSLDQVMEINPDLFADAEEALLKGIDEDLKNPNMFEPGYTCIGCKLVGSWDYCGSGEYGAPDRNIYLFYEVIFQAPTADNEKYIFHTYVGMNRLVLKADGTIGVENKKADSPYELAHRYDFYSVDEIMQILPGYDMREEWGIKIKTY